MPKLFVCIGAGPGISFATALRFAQEGYTPVLVSRKREHLAPLAAEIHTLTGQQAKIETADAASAEDLERLGREYPHIAVLHYNAARLHEQTLEDASYPDLEKDISIGITGALYSLKAFAPSMLERQAGTILFTSGAFALDPLPQFLTLGVAKAGIRNMTQALFPTFAQKNVHIADINIFGVIPPRSEKAKAVGEIFWKIHTQPHDRWTWNEDYKD